MSLTTGFIASLLSKKKGEVYAKDFTPGYDPPRLQIALIENPGITAFKAVMGDALQDIPMFGTHGMKWLTVSDGKHSITGVLNPDFAHLIDDNQLKDNSIIELDAYSVRDNPDEAAMGRLAALQVGLVSILRTDFPGWIGEPVNVFDAKASPVVLPPRLTPGFVDIVQSQPSRGICTSARECYVRVTSIDKPDADTWHIIVFDGAKSMAATMYRKMELAEHGIQDHLPNNLASIMTNGPDALKVNDIIFIPQFGVLSAASGMRMGLFNLKIVYHA